MTDISKEAVEALIKRLRGRPLYEGYGEALDAPDEAADTLAALVAENARLTERVDELTQERDMFGDRIDELVAENARLTGERDEALDWAEELEAEQGKVSAEFEGDLWAVVRQILNNTDFDWESGDVPSEGVTADDAFQHITETIRDLDGRATRAEAEVAALRAEVAAARERGIREAAAVALDEAARRGPVISAAGYRHTADRILALLPTPPAADARVREAAKVLLDCLHAQTDNGRKPKRSIRTHSAMHHLAVALTQPHEAPDV